MVALLPPTVMDAKQLRDDRDGCSLTSYGIISFCQTCACVRGAFVSVA